MFAVNTVLSLDKAHVFNPRKAYCYIESDRRVGSFVHKGAYFEKLLLRCTILTVKL